MTERTSVLDLSSEEAKNFFLKEESYRNFDLPPYFMFESLLTEVSKEANEEVIKKFEKKKWKLSSRLGVNYLIYGNKDGKLSWRPFQLIHPLIYTGLVNKITGKNNWKKLKQRFEGFQKNKKIRCLSIPVQSNSKKSDKAEQILGWWENVEQESITLALEYEYLFETDIADCYGSIYTHSIAWAVETKEIAKKNYQRSLLGNFIDGVIQDAQNGQTNGIPQGSVLMDFVAEMVLGYLDELLSEKISESEITEYQILRYRDDYRVFVQSERDGETILKLLSEVLMPFGLKLNASKTKGSKDIITSSIKADKLAWLQTSKGTKGVGIQKQLLVIYQHSLEFPNSGSLAVALTKINKKITRIFEKEKEVKNPHQIISIVTNIAFSNPRCIPVCCAIVSQILSAQDVETAKKIAHKVNDKMQQMPNSGFAQIWLQRMLKNHLNEFSFNETLCSYVSDGTLQIWNSDWISSNKIKDILGKERIFNQQLFSGLNMVIANNEFNLFDYQMDMEELLKGFESVEEKIRKLG